MSRIKNILRLISSYHTLKDRVVAPEDMSRDRTNEFLSICRSMGTGAMQVTDIL